MFVRVKFIGSFASLYGKKEVKFKVEKPCSLGKIVTRVGEGSSALNSALFDKESGSPKKNLLVLVNGKEVSVLNNWETIIGDGDEVTFIPVVHGG